MQMGNIVAIVTGGASGLGEAAARRILDRGGRVCIVDMDEEKGTNMQKELGSSCLFAKADVTDAHQASEAFNSAIESFGSINVCINCAGIAAGQKVISRKGVHDLELFSKVISVNLIGTFNMIRLAAEKMKNNEPNEGGERGVIISTSSVAAFEGQIGQAAYSASKGGVASMTLPIARELAEYGIRVMAIAPGLFHTPMFDSLPEESKAALGKTVPFPRRLGFPEEFAMLAQSIIENPMLNGETIRLDGAIRMQPK
ncbi:3-hydroxyacyl-CoA dehydrogenase [Bacillus infantis]|uniref:3-hydroxyacyl-CoA dehydrogenase n=1 Tax=Bacillus infantis TaxID=324767 RepID=A0A5D4RES7_9BACI|nr:3-hydroxyacyl-CoA dehydrogenase [Bacillus infantis]TYS47982.1 3-hydroxyacyl-CoA dehydrogenase [Bacillus infantis]